MQERYFYHSFPRRADAAGDRTKGLAILTAIRDIGLLLVPEYIEWQQPTVSGQPRIFPVFQKRVCFTELSPSELLEHSAKFGEFALEFDAGTVRRLGAIPVFYLPQPDAGGANANALGIALLASVIDAGVVVNRITGLDNIFRGAMPVADRLDVNFGFAREPELAGRFSINTAEAREFIEAVGHAVTPWASLNMGVTALLNFFYPADNTRHDRLLEYYRQREWRIATGFAINGVEVLRGLSEPEKDQIRRIDEAFFGRQIRTDLATVDTLDQALVHPGINGERIVAMARRVIAPEDTVDSVRQLLADLPRSPEVVSIESLGEAQIS